MLALNATGLLLRMKGCRNCYYQRDCEVDFDKRRIYGHRRISDGIHVARVMAQLRVNAERLDEGPAMTQTEARQLWEDSFQLAQSVQDM